MFFLSQVALLAVNRVLNTELSSNNSDDMKNLVNLVTNQKVKNCKNNPTFITHIALDCSSVLRKNISTLLPKNY